MPTASQPLPILGKNLFVSNHHPFQVMLLTKKSKPRCLVERHRLTIADSVWMRQIMRSRNCRKIMFKARRSEGENFSTLFLHSLVAHELDSKHWSRPFIFLFSCWSSYFCILEMHCSNPTTFFNFSINCSKIKNKARNSTSKIFKPFLI